HRPLLPHRPPTQPHRRRPVAPRLIHKQLVHPMPHRHGAHPVTAPACPLDGKPVHDQAAICAACTADLTQALAEMPALLDDLDLTLSRQTALGERHGGRSSEKALPYDVRASDVST